MLLSIPLLYLHQTCSHRDWINGYQWLHLQGQKQQPCRKRIFSIHTERTAHYSCPPAKKGWFSWRLQQLSMFEHQGSMGDTSEAVDLSPHKTTLRLRLNININIPFDKNWPSKMEISPCVFKYVYKASSELKLKQFYIFRSIITPSSAARKPRYLYPVFSCAASMILGTCLTGSSPPALPCHLVFTIFYFTDF